MQMPWGMSAQKLQPGAIKKMKTGFSIGTGGAKKSRLQLHREEEARKKKAEAEAAAKVYADFVDSFEVSPALTSIFAGPHGWMLGDTAKCPP